MAKVSAYKSHAAVRQILRLSISNVSFYVQLTGVSSLFRIQIRRDPLLFPRSGSSSTVIYAILLKTTHIFSTFVGFALKNLFERKDQKAGVNILNFRSKDQDSNKNADSVTLL